MKLLANENFPYASKEILVKTGFDIIHIGQECAGISDEEVMKLAMSEENLILTFDQDYGRLIFKDGYRPPQGVIFFRWEEFLPDEPVNFLIELLKIEKLHTIDCLPLLTKIIFAKENIKLKINLYICSSF